MLIHNQLLLLLFKHLVSHLIGLESLPVSSFDLTENELDLLLFLLTPLQELLAARVQIFGGLVLLLFLFTL